MIYTFLGQEKIIELLPNAVREGRAPHLFASDSLTLVVGPNDSGKTKLLAQMCHSVADAKDETAEGDVSLSNVGVVYYSPAPFDPSRFPDKRRKRVEIRSPSTGKSELSPELLTQLRDSFGFSASRKLKLRVLPEDGVQALLGTAMEIPSKIGVFPELKPALDGYQRASLAWHGGGESGVSISTSQEVMLEAQRNLKREIHHLVRKRIGKRADLYLIALAVNHRAGKRNRGNISAFWELLQGKHVSNALISTLEELRELSELHDIEDLVKGIDLDEVADVSSLERFLNLVAIELDGLSSGAEAIVRQFGVLSSAIDRVAQESKVECILVLIDEGDAFLHLAWQQRYIMALDQFLAKKRGRVPVQAVVATHSPVLMSDFPRDYIVRMGTTAPADAELLSFAAPLEKIVECTAGAGSIGKIAVKVIAEQIKLGDNADRRIVDWVDDPLLRDFLIKRIEHAC